MDDQEQVKATLLERYKRRRPKGGRPALVDSMKLTKEMEEFSQLIRAGFSPEECADKLSIPLEKAITYTEAPIIQARIKHLLNNKMDRWTTLRDRLYEECLEACIVLVKDRKIPWQYMMQLIDRLEDSYAIYKRSAEQTQKVIEETTTKETTTPRGTSIFTEKEIKTLEQKTKSD